MAGPRLIGRTVPEVAGKALGKKGLAFGALITDWPSIVGHQLALRTQPDKLVFPRGKREDATLHVRAMGAIALELQHLEPLIIEKINGFFGYKAVSRLRLVHAAPISTPTLRAPQPRPLSMDEEITVMSATSTIEDEGLREALERFGRSLLGRRRT
ncbi:MAG TPA: DciA family protein [Azospirillum sp.]|nr:DciA family protein [Azospirillum sp.]